jgi:hypothetical protein
MTEDAELDPTMLEHMQILSMTHDVMDRYREVVLTAIIDSESMVEEGVDEDNEVQYAAMRLASEISPGLLAERLLFGDNLMLDIALGLETEVRAIWATITEDDLRKKKKRQLSKKQRKAALVYTDALVDVAEAIRDRISNTVCPDCGTHAIPNGGGHDE